MIKRLTIAQRVMATSTLAVVLVVTTFGIVADHTLRAAVATWSREDLAALGHHVAEMLSHAPDVEQARVLSRISDDLAGFGVSAALSAPGVLRQSAVRVPLPDGAVIELRRTKPPEVELGARLAQLNLMVGLASLVSLLVAVQVSLFWSIGRPLRQVRGQLRRMRVGPWTTRSTSAGAREVIELSQELESVGETLDRRIAQWVGAERLATAEMTRLRLTRALKPLVHEANLMISELLGRQTLPPDDVRVIRRLGSALDHLSTVVDEKLGNGGAGISTPPEHDPADDCCQPLKSAHDVHQSEPHLAQTNGGPRQAHGI